MEALREHPFVTRYNRQQAVTGRQAARVCGVEFHMFVRGAYSLPAFVGARPRRGGGHVARRSNPRDFDRDAVCAANKRQFAGFLYVTSGSGDARDAGIP